MSKTPVSKIPVSKIQSLVTKLDTEINKTYDLYLKLHAELDLYRGKPIGDTNLNEVNRILKEIQLQFAELYPAYHFITFRNEYAINTTKSYNDFIDTIKRAGAHRNETSVDDTTSADNITESTHE